VTSQRFMRSEQQRSQDVCPSLKTPQVFDSLAKARGDVESRVRIPAVN
jgi:hypothetical protein